MNFSKKLLVLFLLLFIPVFGINNNSSINNKQNQTLTGYRMIANNDYTLEGLNLNYDCVSNEKLTNENFVNPNTIAINFTVSETETSQPWYKNIFFIIGMSILLLLLLLTMLLIVWYFAFYRKELKSLRKLDKDIRNKKSLKELRNEYPIINKKNGDKKPNSSFLDFLIPLGKTIDPLFDKKQKSIKIKNDYKLEKDFELGLVSKHNSKFDKNKKEKSVKVKKNSNKKNSKLDNDFELSSVSKYNSKNWKNDFEI